MSTRLRRRGCTPSGSAAQFRSRRRRAMAQGHHNAPRGSQPRSLLRLSGGASILYSFFLLERRNLFRGLLRRRLIGLLGQPLLPRERLLGDSPQFELDVVTAWTITTAVCAPVALLCLL
eukprot:4252136-Prymnesium_polylepis.1